MFVKSGLLALALAALASTASAQSTAPAPVSAAKKELVARVLELQRPGIENMARQLTEQPAMQMLQQASVALQRLPAERREAVARDLQADARKYAEETTPLVRDRAVRLAPATIGPLLEQSFTEDELRQIIGILESPVNRKFQQLGGEMQKTLGEKLVGETRPVVEPKVKALEQSFVKRLQAAAPAGAASGPPR